MTALNARQMTHNLFLIAYVMTVLIAHQMTHNLFLIACVMTVLNARQMTQNLSPIDKKIFVTAVESLSAVDLRIFDALFYKVRVV
jgi:hypothetical protein